MQAKQKLNFTTKMLISLFSAIITGTLLIILRENIGTSSPLWGGINNIFFQDITQEGAQQAIGLFYITGKLFLNTLQLVLVPLVFTSIVLAICHMQNAKTLERLSLKTLWAFLSLSILALLLAAIVGYTSYLFGVFNIDIQTNITSHETMTMSNPLMLFVTLIPNNLMGAFGNNGAILSLVLISLAVGLCINFLGEQVATLKNLIAEVNQLTMTFLTYVITKVAPYAIFTLLVRTFATYGIEYLQPAAIYMGMTITTLLIFLLIVMPAYVKITTNLNPFIFIKKMMPIALFGFSTSSSAATLPLNTKVCHENLGISDDVAAFVLPLGSAMNKTGTAIMQVIAVMFIAGVAGYTVSPLTLIVVILLTLVASVSTPAIPGAGAIVLFTILSGVGFVNESALIVYSLILAINPPVEMFSTALNVVDDTVSALVIAKSENVLDEATYNNITTNKTTTTTENYSR